MAVNTKRKLVEEKIFKTLSTIDPSGTNTDRYKKLFSNMSDQEFDKFMFDLKNKKVQLSVFTPNMKLPLKQDNILKAADQVGAILFERVWMEDSLTGKKYLTPMEYLIIKLPIRRARQFLMHKMSVGESDKKIDSLTGQVIKPDRAASMSFVESQILYSKGMTNTITECLKVRGGDIHAFANYKSQLEETGSFQLTSLDENTVPRVTAVTSVLLKCMYFDNNMVQ